MGKTKVDLETCGAIDTAFVDMSSRPHQRKTEKRDMVEERYAGKRVEETAGE